MSASSKIIQAAAGNAAGEPLYVEEVFSTYLYEGTGSAQTITNGVDLDGEGGLVWVKGRNFSSPHILVDTDRGVNNNLRSHQTIAEYTQDTVTAFNSTGFTVTGANGDVGSSGNDYVSWTFAKQKKFFDVVTYTGTGLTAQNISHNLGSVPGCIIVKQTDNTNDWWVYHRGVDATSPEDYVLKLNGTDARNNIVLWNDTAPTDSVFTVYGNGTNATNGNFVAYLFAHNDGDGEFGENADQDIIKCGSYTGGTAPISVDLGFEPQWILIKGAVGSTQNWVLFDTMRGIATGGADEYLSPNVSNAETTFGSDYIDVTATGFEIKSSNNAFVSQNSATYIYIAIRRGPMKTPESGTEVFAIDFQTATSTVPNFYSGFPVDMGIRKYNVSGIDEPALSTRLLGKSYLFTSETDAENDLSIVEFDHMDGWTLNKSTNAVSWMFRRAPGFFDVVAYEGTGVAQDIPHNLGVAPEMMIFKCRDLTNTTYHWQVYHTGMTSHTYAMFLNLTNSQSSSSTNMAADPTATHIKLGTTRHSNQSGGDFIAYLFATLPGVSKVGEYTGEANTINIDCGFTNGARFVLIKEVNSAGAWYVWDSERGIVAGNDPYLMLNSDQAQITNADAIDPYSAGFSVNYNVIADLNVPGNKFMFYAIA